MNNFDHHVSTAIQNSSQYLRKYASAFICLTVILIPGLAYSSCPSQAMQVRFETKVRSQWIEQRKSVGDTVETWGRLIEDIRKSGKALYCCSDTIDLYEFRVVVPPCNDVGNYYSSSYYIMGIMKDRKPTHLKLFWNSGGTRAEPGKTYEIAIAKKFYVRISRLIAKSFVLSSNSP